ncbi:hypothetical protein [Amaricoccus macauensis]|uniref:hypothetical protein n=1 Tax=Amaricoccus macauensis TaxID=57001 RepID=UPI003C7ED334
MFHFFFPWFNFASKFALPLESKDREDIEVRSESPEAVKEEPLPEDIMDDIAVNSGSGKIDVPREDLSEETDPSAVPSGDVTSEPAPDLSEPAEEAPGAESILPEPISLEGQKIKLWGLASDGPEADTITSAGGKVMVGVGKTTTMVVTNGPITPEMEESKIWTRIQELRAEGQQIDLMEWTELRARLDAS